MFQYRNILKSAWLMTWRHKYLWFFGLFATFLGGSGEYELIGRFLASDQPSLFPSLNMFSQTGILSWNTFGNIKNIMMQSPVQFVQLLITLLIIVFILGFIVWLSNVSQAAIVNNTALTLAGKNSSFSNGFYKGLSRFWPILGLNAISKGIVLVLASIIVISFKVLPGWLGQAAANTAYIFSFILFVPALIISILIIKYSIAYTVIKDEPIVNSLKSGWKLFKDNWLVTSEVAVILFLLSLIFGLAVGIFILTAFIPMYFLIFLSAAISTSLQLAVLILSVMALIAIVVILGSLFTVFQISAWTILFAELIGRGGMSKISRIVSGWSDQQ